MLNTTQRSDRHGRRVCLLLCMALLAMAPTRHAAATGVGYVPSAVEASILETVLADEVRALEQGGQTALLAQAGASPSNGATSASASSSSSPRSTEAIEWQAALLLAWPS